MKTLRTLALIITLCLLFSFLIGCNAEPEEPSSESTSQSSTKKTTAQKATIPAKTYDEERPKNPAVLPKYGDDDFEIPNMPLGQQSEMHIAIETNKTEYNDYLNALEADGYSFYADNEIGDNLYATYINDTHILNVMYINAFKQTRVIIDDRTVFALPGLEKENVYEETSDCSLTLLSDDAVGWPGRMGYIYKLADGSFFIIDGGYTKSGDGGNSSEPYIMSVLEKYADDPNNITIAAWLISHVHSDHLGGFLDMSSNTEIKERIHIEKVIYNMPCEADLSEQDLNSNGTTTMTKWGEKLENAIIRWSPDAIIKAHPGQVFHIRNLKLTIYHSQDLMLGTPLTSSNPKLVYKSIKVHNNTSIVSKVEFMGKTALYLADSSAQANKSVLDPVYNTSLQADIVQVAHHGYGDTSAGNVYKHITPSMVFWPVCKQHYDGLNHDGSIYYEKGSAYSGVSSVGFNVEYLFKEGIKHYYHGGDCITFSDFETWEGVRWDAVPN